MRHTLPRRFVTGRSAGMPQAELAALVLSLLAGCYSVPPEVRKTPVTPDAGPASRPVGGDRDAHGCIASAGYAWCAREERCVRPWELAQQAGVENTAEGFAAHCDAAASGG